MADGITPILDAQSLADARIALAEFTPDAVQELLGPVGRSAHARGDLAGVNRVLPGGERLSTLVRMFLLGRSVDEREARHALGPLDPARAPALFDHVDDRVRARLEVRPYQEHSGTDPWWVLSDFGSDVRPGPLAHDHVLGIGAASLTLAQAVIREPVGRALDIGIGSGVQALHLAQHAQSVTGVDISRRALRLAATTAALSGQSWDLREGSLLDPVQGELFDLIVANPPFVVSAGRDVLSDGSSQGHDYRDSGLAGDEVCRVLVAGVPALLAPGGTASLLANWIVAADGEWTERVRSWLYGSGCDAWVWQRELVEPGDYVALWLRDAGETAGSPRWIERYDAWLDWFDAHDVGAVGMGLVTLWRTDSADPVIVCEEVPQAVEQPAGAHLPKWVARQRWLAAADDATLLTARLRAAPGLVRVRHDLRELAGWRTELTQLRQSHDMRWEIEADDTIAGLVGACAGTVSVTVLGSVLAAALGVSSDDLVSALLPVVRELVARGFLEPDLPMPSDRVRSTG